MIYLTSFNQPYKRLCLRGDARRLCAAEGAAFLSLPPPSHQHGRKMLKNSSPSPFVVRVPWIVHHPAAGVNHLWLFSLFSRLIWTDWMIIESQPPISGRFDLIFTPVRHNDSVYRPDHQRADAPGRGLCRLESRGKTIFSSISLTRGEEEERFNGRYSNSQLATPKIKH